MIRGELIVDNFAGGGGASTGIEEATGYSVDIAINHDPEAIKMHKANHPYTKHYCEDVWQVDPVKACSGHPVGLAWFSPDCFVKGTLVLTENGYQPIENLQVGDRVLTHKGNWKPITAVMTSEKKSMRIAGYGNTGLVCSEEHPFLVKHCPNVWKNDIRQYRRSHNEMQWVKAKDIKKDMYWASKVDINPLPIPQMEKANNKAVVLPIDERLLWLAGRYVGDGWTRLTDTHAELVIICGGNEVTYLKKKLDAWPRKGDRCKNGELSWSYRNVRTGGQFTASNRGLVEWLRSNFGHTALRKTIPAWLYAASKSYKEAFMDGYLSADGWTNGNKIECSTVSKKLAYGIRTLAVTMGYSPTIYLQSKVNNVIEGRIVNSHEIYTVKWKTAVDKNHEQTFTEDGYLWTPIKKVEQTGRVEKFYNISVQDDETYIAEGIVVHNCKHFSKAKGGKPKDKFIRGLAWVACRWAGLVRPRVIMLENVEEFKTWGPLNRGHHPIKSKQGDTFRKFVQQLTELGYHVEFKELIAADYGAPTMRKRFFLIARCDGKPIVWPEPTHAPADSDAVKNEVKKPYVGACTQLDFSLPCPSIFETSEEIKEKYGIRAVRPLAPKTMERIARGIKKFVLDNPEPFIVQCNHGGKRKNGSIRNPMPTITGKHGFGIVEPKLAPVIDKAFGGNYAGCGSRVDAPIDTITTVDHNRLVEATLAPCIMRNNENNVDANVESPLPTITTENRNFIMAPTLIQYHSETSKGGVRGQRITDPIMTVDGSNRYGLVASFLSKFYKSGTGQDVREPLHTITTSPGHFGEVRAFLVKYYGTGLGQKVDEPLDTITSRDRFGLVTIKGIDYQIVDIGLRMLEPKELYGCQGFPDDYIIDHDYKGKKYPRSEQVRRCGNSVCPPIPAALVRANLPELCIAKRTPNLRVCEEESGQMRFA